LHQTQNNDRILNDKIKMKKTNKNWNAIISIVFLLSVLGSSLFVAWDKYQLNYKIKEIRNQTKIVNREILQTSQDYKANQIKSAITAIENANIYRLLWSRILTDVLQLEGPQIKFVSFSSGRSKKISLQGTGTSWESISRLIERAKANPKFSDPFIHSISEHSIGNQKPEYKFGLTFLHIAE